MESIIRVFPRKTSMTPTDDYAFVGDPPLWRPEAKEVHVSVAFTWDMWEGLRLSKAWGQYYPDVRIGGPAFASPVNGFVMGRYLKPGVTITSRGCNNNCPWCLVREREGKLREYDFWAGSIIQDNNFFQCSGRHLDRVFTMLSGQHGIVFSGGLAAELLTAKNVDRLRGLRISQLFFACDTKEAIKTLRKAGEKLKDFPRDKLRCYVLLAYKGETIGQARERLALVWEAGFIPFSQLYQPPEKHIDYPLEWTKLNWFHSRPAAMKAYYGK